MEAFKTHTGIVAPIDRANVDTDAIIPKQFLKSIKRTGFGEQLFYDWRYLPDHSDNPAFILNREPFNKATVLVTRNNFGCGSSREHAVWAVAQFGFKVLIAPRKRQADGTVIPGFADIFRNNCVKNGILTIELSEDEVERIFRVVAARAGMEAEVNLEQQQLTIGDEVFSFKIDPGIKDYLMRGLDEISLTLEKLDEIQQFEVRHDVQLG